MNCFPTNSRYATVRVYKHTNGHGSQLELRPERCVTRVARFWGIFARHTRTTVSDTHRDSNTIESNCDFHIQVKKKKKEEDLVFFFFSFPCLFDVKCSCDRLLKEHSSSRPFINNHPKERKKDGTIKLCERKDTLSCVVMITN